MRYIIFILLCFMLGCSGETLDFEYVPEGVQLDEETAERMLEIME